MPSISVIIPVYNVEKYIKECLDSVVQQSFTDVEIICVDDCGSDGSMGIVEAYAARDSRIRIVRHPHNLGLAPARNSGMAAASGRYLMFLDSDDFLPEKTLENLHDAMAKGGADIVVGHFRAFADEDDPHLINAATALNSRFDSLVTRDITVTMENFQKELKTIYGVVWGMLYSAEFLKQHAISFPDRHLYHEDMCFFLKCYSAFPTFRIIPALTALYRMRANSITNTHNKRLIIKRKRDFRLALQEAFDHIVKQYGEEKGGHIIELIKGQRSYRRLLEKRYLGGLFTKKWIGTDRLFLLGGICVYRESYTEDYTVERRIFGIPFSK